MVEHKKDESIPEFLLDNPTTSKEPSKLTVLVKDPLAAEISKEGSLSEREVGVWEKGMHEVKKVFTGETHKEISAPKEEVEEEETKPKGFIGKTLELFGVGTSTTADNK